MDLEQAIRTRHSVRAYLDREVPEDEIADIVRVAALAPSSSNVQPWHVAVVSGEARRKLEDELVAEVTSGTKPYPHFRPGAVGVEGAYMDRKRECGFLYYDALGIERGDRPERERVALLNWRFFGAPHAMFVSMPAAMGEVSGLDVGLFLQTLMLTMHARGLGCIPQGALAQYPGPVKRLADIPAGNEILCGLSFGYPDPSAPINDLRMPRKPIGETLSFTR